MGGSGGHSDTAAGAKLAMIIAPLFRARLPIVREHVHCISTPGKDIDVLVTQAGIAVNPKNVELTARLQEAGLPIVDIRFLKEKAEQLTGVPRPLVRGDRVVADIISRDGSLLDYAQCKNMTVQAWSVLQASWEEGSFLDHPNYPELNEVLGRLAEQYGVTKSAIAIAWLLRHPAKIQPIAGTANPQHLRELVKAADITLTRPEWYELYLSAGRKLP